MATPRTFTCAKPGCRMELRDPRPADMIHEPPTYGDILLCGMCGSINVIDLTDTHEITDEELATLDADTRSNLDFAQRAVRRGNN